MNRRDLLRARLMPLMPLAASVAEVSLLRLGWRAMATHWQIQVPHTVPHALEAGKSAFALLDQLEEQLTVYRDDSELSKLNRQAFQRAVRVEPRLFELLLLCARLHAETEGSFDVSAGALIKAWGFFRGPRRVPSAEELLSARSRVGMDQIVLNAATREVRYRVSGLELNLGAIGKGYALDRLVELLTQRHRWNTMLLHGGQSSLRAVGSPHQDGRGWSVGIRHPENPRRRLATVWLRGRALGTSAATFQHLEHQGKKLGHILDPRTGWPASGLASVSVLAPTAAEADALSTAFFVGGLALARQYCERRPDIGAILLPQRPECPELFASTSTSTLETPEIQQRESSLTPVILNLTAEDILLSSQENAEDSLAEEPLDTDNI